MSVEFSVYSVAWDDLMARLGRGESLETLLGETWEPLELEVDSVMVSGEFLDAFDQVQAEWHGLSRDTFESLFPSLFWSWRSPELRWFELPGGYDEQRYPGIDSAWGPALVARYAKNLASLDLTELTPLYPKHVQGVVSMPDLAAFKAYAEQWCGVIAGAAARGEGLLVGVFA